MANTDLVSIEQLKALFFLSNGKSYLAEQSNYLVFSSLCFPLSLESYLTTMMQYLVNNISANVAFFILIPGAHL